MGHLAVELAADWKLPAVVDGVELNVGCVVPVSAYEDVAAATCVVDVFVLVLAGADVVIAGSAKHASDMKIKILAVLIIDLQLIKQTVYECNAIWIKAWGFCKVYRDGWRAADCSSSIWLNATCSVSKKKPDRYD